MRQFQDIMTMLWGAVLTVVSGVAFWEVCTYNRWNASLNSVVYGHQAVGKVEFFMHSLSDLAWQSFGWFAPGLFLALGCAGLMLFIGRPLKRWKSFLFLPAVVFALGATHALGLEGKSGVVGYLLGKGLKDLLQTSAHAFAIKALLYALLAVTFFTFINMRVVMRLAHVIRGYFSHYLEEKRNAQPSVRRIVHEEEKMVASRGQQKDPKSRDVRVARRAEEATYAPSIDSPDKKLIPPTTILEPGKTFMGSSMTGGQLKDMEIYLLKILKDYGVNGTVAQVRAGPVVSLFEFVPAAGVKSSRIISLSDDIARAMKAHSVRISMLPGQDALGIEISNQKREIVSFRPLLEEVMAQCQGMRLPIVLGRNIAGDPVAVDLADMPHLLVAGTTGSGKSVGLNVIITSLLYQLSFEQCKFLMIDPKILELSVYEGIPHLLTGVVTKPKNAAQALQWLVQEMEERYQLMAQVGVRNLDGFNAVIRECYARGEPLLKKVQTGFDETTGEPTYDTQELPAEIKPYIVAIIDEMADLMLTAGKLVEVSLQRLAQKARAAGIHVIMATQRPSVDVVTGTIKANFPSRLVFQVSSKIDSRTVIGEQGAEKLLGKGDMLYLTAGGKLQRLHGPFLQESDIATTVHWLQKHVGPPNLQPIFAAKKTEGDDFSGEDVELYQEARDIVINAKRASTSFLQRKLQIGYNKAASLIEALEENGIVSEADHVGRRRVLVEEKS